MPKYKGLPTKKKVVLPGSLVKYKVVIEVRGGVAEVTRCPRNVEVEIIDHDALEETGEDTDA